jgi:hypothetical protein
MNWLMILGALVAIVPAIAVGVYLALRGGKDDRGIATPVATRRAPRRSSTHAPVPGHAGRCAEGGKMDGETTDGDPLNRRSEESLEEYLARLRGLDRSALTEDQRLSLEVLLHSVRHILDRDRRGADRRQA